MTKEQFVLIGQLAHTIGANSVQIADLAAAQTQARKASTAFGDAAMTRAEVITTIALLAKEWASEDELLQVAPENSNEQAALVGATIQVILNCIESVPLSALN